MGCLESSTAVGSDPPTALDATDVPCSGHVVNRQANLALTHNKAGIASPFCCEFTLQGSCTRKACNFQEECPLCLGPRTFSACPKIKVKPHKFRGGRKQGSSLADKGHQSN